MGKSCSVKPRSQARGIIPSKVSELENDIPFVTEEQLRRIADTTGYSGSENDTAKVEVDNLTRTISVLVKPELIIGSLPKDEKGNFIDGSYLLCAAVVDGVPKLNWVEATDSGEGVVISPYYYGQVSIGSLEDLTAQHIKDLTKDGLTKSNREYTFESVKQRQVLAYPSKFGELSTIIHKQTGFPVTSAFEKINMTIDGVSYLVYISYNPSTGTYTYNFNY